MKQLIYRIAAIDIWECSNKLSEMQQSTTWNAAIKYSELGIYYSGIQRKNLFWKAAINIIGNPARNSQEFSNFKSTIDEQIGQIFEVFPQRQQ